MTGASQVHLLPAGDGDPDSPVCSTTAHGGGSIALSIIIPTFNEVGNVGELIDRLRQCLRDVTWEALVVDDDSPDGTAALVQQMGEADSRIRCLKRVGRRGLAGACIEGMAAGRGELYAIIDADLQHDEQLIPRMLGVMTAAHVDMVVGSRYLPGGDVGSWNPARARLSRMANALTQHVLGIRMTDPMSGFFMVRQSFMRAHSSALSDTGFKLLLDIVASSATPLHIVELPYRFSVRKCGLSKLDSGVGLAFLAMLARHSLTKTPAPFLRFCAVGISGVIVHMTIFQCLIDERGLRFAEAQTAAVLVSMASNFTLNNRLTFTHARLHGARFYGGLSRFAVLCSIGAIFNLAIAQALSGVIDRQWIAAGLGVLAGAACNYGMASRFVWRRSDRTPS